MGESIMKIINVLSEKMGIIVDWSAENIVPYLIDLASRIVKFTMIKPIIITIICTIIFIIIIIKFMKKIKLLTNDEELFKSYNNKKLNIFDETFSLLKYYLILLIISMISIHNITQIVDCVVLPERVILNTIIKIQSEQEEF